MADPLFIPTLAALSGGSFLLLRDYFQHRLNSPEDRFMQLCGEGDWEDSNMDFSIHFAPADDEAFKNAFAERLQANMQLAPEHTQVLRETVRWHKNRPEIDVAAQMSWEQMCLPRKGVYFDIAEKGRIRIVWSHMLTDGVGIWRALNGLMDNNPPLVNYSEMKIPPAVLPEFMALPALAQRLSWQSSLRKAAGPPRELTRGLVDWDAGPLRAYKKQLGNPPFNLLTSALVVEQIFAQHPQTRELNVGLTAYFPFLRSRNKYAVCLCRVKRGSVAQMAQQLQKQVANKMVSWGQSSAQNYVLTHLPKASFEQVVSHFREKIDVLISSLPIGQNPVSVAGIPARLSCHPTQLLTLPYYVLLIGTRNEINVSYTSRFESPASFLQLPEVQAEAA